MSGQAQASATTTATTTTRKPWRGPGCRGWHMRGDCARNETICAHRGTEHHMDNDATWRKAQRAYREGPWGTKHTGPSTYIRCYIVLWCGVDTIQQYALVILFSTRLGPQQRRNKSPVKQCDDDYILWTTTMGIAMEAHSAI